MPRAMDHWVFLSHGRYNGEDDPYVLEFVDELRTQVNLHLNPPRKDPVFFDTNIKTGAVWENDIQVALASCRIMVCLCSTAYVNSEYCGKELRVFSDRVAAYRPAQRLTESPRLIMPVLWGPPSAAFPEVITRLQYKGTEPYTNEGLRYLKSLNEHRDAYTKFVRQLAADIVAEATAHPLTDQFVVPPLASVRSIFASAPTVRVPAGRSARFVYVAATPEEIAQVRGDPEAYRPTGGRYWQPYRPDCPDEVGLIAQEAATRHRLFVDDVPVDQGLLDRIDEAERNGEVVILLVDPWTVSLRRYREVMTSYDRRNFTNSAVLVLWNETDPETASKRTAMQEAVRKTFRFVTQRRRTIYYRDSIRSAKDLRSRVLKTITEIQAEIRAERNEVAVASDDAMVQEAEAARGSTIVSAPIVSGPAGTQP